MIRIVVGTPAPTGFYPYKIEGHWDWVTGEPGSGAPLIGIAEDPIAEACRVLQALGIDLGTRIRIEAPQTRLGAIRASGLLGNFLKKVVAVLPRPEIGGDRTADRQGRGSVPLLSPPTQTPRRARRRVLKVTGSGVPGDG